jgi:hypothetical protein
MRCPQWHPRRPFSQARFAYGEGMAEIKTVHIWMLDGRSLCDRRPFPSHRGETEAQLTASQIEAENAPACGACLLLAGRVRREATAIIERHSTVHPMKASGAWESLRETRWSNYFDLDAFKASAENVDAGTRYDGVKLGADPATVMELVQEWDEKVSNSAMTRDQLGGKGTPDVL